MLLGLMGVHHLVLVLLFDYFVVSIYAGICSGGWDYLEKLEVGTLSGASDESSFFIG